MCRKDISNHDEDETIVKNENIQSSDGKSIWIFLYIGYIFAL